MKISLGLVACAFLASGFSAVADPAAKPRYKQNGDLCTAEEVANPPRVKVKGYGRTFNVRVDCRTAPEWKLRLSMQAQRDRDQARLGQRMASGLTGEGSPPRALPSGGSRWP